MTADLIVYEGRKTEDLGINFRNMVDAILRGHLVHQTENLIAIFECTRKEVVATIDRHLRFRLFAETTTGNSTAPTSFWQKWLGHVPDRKQGEGHSPSETDRLAEVLAEWEQALRATEDDCERACLEALRRVVTSVAGRHGRVVGDIDLISSIATNLVMNDFGSAMLGKHCSRTFVRRPWPKASGYCPHRTSLWS